MRILVVDDDSMAGEMTAAVLEYAGHEVVFSENGVDAADKLDGIELIVSDMNMPLISGIELFRTLREQEVDIPFILLTGDDPEPLKTEEPRLDACLIKDFNLENALPSAISEVLTRRGMSQSDID